MSAHTSFLYSSILYLIATALVLPYSAYCIYRFINVTKENANDKYFKHRHSIFNIIFLLCFFIATFIISPLEVVVGIIGYQDRATIEIEHIMYDLTSVIIFAIFMCRVWFLFSDWSFHYNMSSWIWKREINPLEKNFIIKYRRIFGNRKCCYFFIFFILFLPIIIILDIIPLFINDSSQILFRIGILILFISFTLFILLSQLKRVLDVYHIRQELITEIAIFGSLLLFSEIFSNLLLLTDTINRTQQILFLSIFQTIIGVLVIYVGTNWVLKKFKHYQVFQQIGKVSANNVNNDKLKKINTDDLIAILNTEQGFESFLFHLVNELQLEKMLFVIEILQLKQEIKNRLQKTNIQNVYDKSSVEWLKLNYILNNVSEHKSDINNKWDISVLAQLNITDSPNDPRLKEWTLYEFAVHLYDKYIESGAALQLSLSAECERFIYSYFRARTMEPKSTPFSTPGTTPTTLTDGGKSTKNRNGSMDILAGVDEETEEVELVTDKNEKGSQSEEDENDGIVYESASIIPTQLNEDRMEEEMDNMVGIDGVNGDQNINVVYDLFRLYDNAVYEVWNTIANQIFNRFKTTSEYGTIYESIYNVKDMGQTRLMDSGFHKKKLRLEVANSLSVN